MSLLAGAGERPLVVVTCMMTEMLAGRARALLWLPVYDRIAAIQRSGVAPAGGKVYRENEWSGPGHVAGAAPCAQNLGEI